MKLIKKMIAASLALALVLSMSGCYWEGKTKWRSEQLLLNELEEKYNEEFIIRQIGVSSARSGGPLVAYCSPKDDKELVFETELYQFGDNISLRDMYIQSIVRREMKDIIDSILAEYYNDYAVEINVKGLQPEYNPGITNADEASIKTFTEAVPEVNTSTIFIAINQEEIENYDEIQDVLIQCVKDFHYTFAVIECYFTGVDTIAECNEMIYDDNPDALSIMSILSPGKCISEKKYIMHRYCYYGLESTFRLSAIVDYNGSREPIDSETIKIER